MYLGFVPYGLTNIKQKNKISTKKIHFNKTLTFLQIAQIVRNITKQETPNQWGLLY